MNNVYKKNASTIAPYFVYTSDEQMSAVSECQQCLINILNQVSQKSIHLQGRQTISLSVVYKQLVYFNGPVFI